MLPCFHALVGMAGDGINDAPALTAHPCGAGSGGRVLRLADPRGRTCAVGSRVGEFGDGVEQYQCCC